MNRIRAILRTDIARQLITFTVPAGILLTVLINDFVYGGSQQFSELARAFLHGQLNFLSPIGGFGQDPVLWHGKIYWGEGPFPAVLLMPFVAVFTLFHHVFSQAYLQWALILGVAYFVYRLARLLDFSPEDSLVLTFGFTLGSVFIGVSAIPSAWFFAQVVTTFLIFWSLYEFYTRKRWWLIGIIVALILMTRATATPILLFFALELWLTLRKAPLTAKLNKFAQLGLPVAAALVLIGVYNYLRFQDPLNGGTIYQLVARGTAEYNSLARGVFSPVHIPVNMYHAVFGAPVPISGSSEWILQFPYIKNNPYGMSIFITSPYLLYLFTQKWSSFNARARRLLISIAVSALGVFSFFGVGLSEFGYRYSLDFLPEVFLVLMIIYRAKHRSLSLGMKLLLLGAGLFDFWMVGTIIAANVKPG